MFLHKMGWNNFILCLETVNGGKDTQGDSKLCARNLSVDCLNDFSRGSYIELIHLMLIRVNSNI